MKPTIYLVFVDDWELSGNGSGDVRELQFKPMRELTSLYQEFVDDKGRLTSDWAILNALFRDIVQESLQVNN